MKDLSGQNALVTGGARRLGRRLVEALAAAGAQVVIHYHRSEVAARELAESLERTGVRAEALAADLSDPHQADTLIARATACIGPLDVLINNASIYYTEPLAAVTAESLGTHMALHATAPLLLSRQFAAQGRPGQILNLLDTRVVCRDPQHTAYHLSKRTLLTLTRLLAEELAPAIQVNAVAPGLILAPEGEDETYLQRLAHTNALARHGAPADVVEAALFLLRSTFITGQVLFVDGGHHLKGRLYE